MWPITRIWDCNGYLTIERWVDRTVWGACAIRCSVSLRVACFFVVFTIPFSHACIMGNGQIRRHFGVFSETML